MSTVHIVIPARYGSSRLPGKPLKLIAGKTMIEHVYRQAEKSGFESIIVATDDQRIADCVSDFSGNAIMTRNDHPSGTDRLAEVATLSGWDDDDIVINVQGDEPLLPPETIRYLAELTENSNALLSTLACQIHEADDVFNSNIVKVVMDHRGYAHYFSRAPIPYNRNHFGEKSLGDTAYYRHIGIYAYRVKTLKKIPTLSACPLEQAESLEQLRPMYHGIEIQVGILEKAPPHGVDTAEDLAHVEAILASASDD
ncbi:MAG: 3-deoxy-manno-octulosonate cytidylyltransferase (EC [uncultured Thiotrichaceae bacterium]|uniref:3-deoxy-manno-octulosonate cytidylyltransferase n=1 Tax=uncultured Thiotrichaceae bacterium TaxID=298394 RepID=A0A6S6TTN1_9GAMM|nr:MAG: 3-deoxy-manno-octulosonate cytidylyltransferase (EC [uncultured Thiotrichaceae bacterium]